MLARTLGCTVEELRGRMTVREFRQHQALYALDPWGPERIDLMLARVAAVVANCHTKGGFTEHDFLPKFRAAEDAERTDDDLRYTMMKWTALMGGEFVASK